MPVVDLAFELAGNSLPVDHGYELFSAICRVVPRLHGDRHIGVHAIRGQAASAGTILLGGRSRLRVRLPSEEIAAYLALAGSALDVNGHRLRVGIPHVESLIPTANLSARIVTFKAMVEPDPFLACVRRHLTALGVSGDPQLVPSTREPWTGRPFRRVLRVKGRAIVGYALRVLALTAEESVLIQERGLGGRRRFGCGVFLPLKEVNPR